MTLVIDCLEEFTQQFAVDPLADWNTWLARAGSEDSRKELTRELLICGAELAEWSFDWIVNRFSHASSALTTDSDRVQAVRFLAGFQLRYGPPVKWSDYSRFGLSAESLEIRLTGEPFYLGMLLGGKYSLDERIAHGGFGVVYRATETATGQTCAVKFLAQRSAGRGSDASVGMTANIFENDTRSLECPENAALSNEAALLKAFEGEGLPAYHDFVTVDESPVLVMEHIDGQPLRQLVDEHQIDEENAVRVLSQVADILVRLHEIGCAHLDLSPNNILVGTDGRAYLVDLGTMETEAEIVEPMMRDRGGTPGFSMFASANVYAPVDRLALDWDSLIRVADYVRTGLADDRSRSGPLGDHSLSSSPGGARESFLTRVLRRDEFYSALKDEVMWPRGLPGRLQTYLGIGSPNRLSTDSLGLFAGWMCGRLIRQLCSFLRGEDLVSPALGKQLVASFGTFSFMPDHFASQLPRYIAHRERAARRFGDIEEPENAFRMRCRDLYAEIKDCMPWLDYLRPGETPLNGELQQAYYRTSRACLLMARRPVLKSQESGRITISINEMEMERVENVLDWDKEIQQIGGTHEEVTESVFALLDAVRGAMVSASTQARAVASLSTILEERARASTPSLMNEVVPLLGESGMPEHTWKPLVDRIRQGNSRAGSRQAMALLGFRFGRYIIYGSVDTLPIESL